MQGTINMPKSENNNFISKFVNYKIGVTPLPIFIVLVAIIYFASVTKKLPADMIGGFAIIIVLGTFFGDLGSKLPVLKNIGGAAILSIIIPSMMVYFKLLNTTSMKAITGIMKNSNFLYLYISCLVVGSILGMNRKVLIKGFVRMFVPLVVGTIMAIAGGMLVGLLFGYKPGYTFFYIVAPILDGGIGEGILPLTMGYSDILHQPQSLLIAKLVPAAVLGNIVAIVSAGVLKRYAEKRPDLTGNGLLVKTKEDNEILAEQKAEKPVDFKLMGSGLLIACTFYVFGLLTSPLIGIPAPIIMIFTAAIVKYLNVIPPETEQGVHHLYKFVSSSLTYPLLVGIGVLYTPFSDLVRAITPAYIIICISIVLSMMASGFFIGKYINMYPIESSLVTACHSGLGGTGDVAILSSANRMELMPFSQISTRIGGASMVVIATLLLKMFS
ncbi:Citrate/malate transporter [Clostridium ljungdahlii DSM 13528]|uniref:Citrate/malate transporter n=2 Tax=Clostridium ljungdahlii TaxID=1538 RepID=D8GUJ3_CLOLD|nr:2-hydroxycarboxylate transporter family protein [Clostridium ljungdahlii]ADK16870.1 predicted citrate:cation symporter [Clostridium ljungdahlii DSM 13528]OAA85584.1 Citrate/malate transporter [Clostridium ljungdahlii DSM 13528]